MNQSTERTDRSLGFDAKVGIINGAVIAGLLIFAGIVFLIRRSKRRKRVLDGRDQAADQTIFTGGKAELDSRVRAELDSSGQAGFDLRAQAELDAQNNRAELQ